MSRALWAITLAAGCSIAAAGQTVFEDRGAFIAATGPNGVATFDDVPVMTVAPFTSGGVLIERQHPVAVPEVLSEVAGFPHSFWFPGAGSPPNFLITNIAFKATFPRDVTAAGFDLTCFACSPDRLIWQLYSEGGSLVASGEAFPDFSGVGRGLFFGVASDLAFRSLVVTRSSGGNWFADDVRFSERPATQPGYLGFNPDGVGHILYVPYFSTQEGNVTAINIVNTDAVNGKVLKVRFRGASNSDDVYDFQLFLSPGDMWAAGIGQGPDGRSRLDTTDSSCTLPANVNGPFLVDRTPPAGGNAETREGHIEIVTMADIVAGGDGRQADLYRATRRVIGSAPCTLTLLSALTHENAAQFMAPPTTGLMANWTIINVRRNFAYTGAAVAIEARDLTDEPIAGRIVYWDQQAIALSASEAEASTADPLLRGETPAIAGTRNDLPDLSTPYLQGLAACPFCQARALSDAIAARTVAGEIFREVTVGAQTDWVISFPTRRYFAAVKYGTPNAIVRNAASDGNIYFTTLNTELGSAFNGGKAYQMCTNLGVNAIDVQNRDEGRQILDPILLPPGLRTSLCGAVTVIGFGNVDARDSATFGSLARATGDSGFPEGWASLLVPEESGLPLHFRQFVRVNNTATSVYYGLSYPGRVLLPGVPAPFGPAK